MSYYCDLKDFCYYQNNKNVKMQPLDEGSNLRGYRKIQPIGINGWPATSAMSTGDNLNGFGINEYQTQSNAKKLLPVYEYTKNGNTIYLVFNTKVLENYLNVNFTIDITRNNMMTEYYVPVQSSLSSTLFGYIWTREYNR